MELELYLKPDARIKYYDMWNEGKDKAYLSIKQFLENSYGLSIYQWVDGRILTRLDALHVSVLVEWWTKYITELIPQIREKFQESLILKA